MFCLAGTQIMFWIIAVSIAFLFAQGVCRHSLLEVAKGGRLHANLKKFAQELLSTFDHAIGEVALVPATGGVFQIDLYTESISTGERKDVEKLRLWCRKAQGGFPG